MTAIIPIVLLDSNLLANDKYYYLRMVGKTEGLTLILLTHVR